MNEFSELSENNQKEILKPFDIINTSVKEQSLIAVIRDMIRRFEEDDYKRLLDKMCSFLEQNVDIPNVSEDSSGYKVTKPLSELKVENIKSIQVPFDKSWLADKTDIDNYLSAMKKILMKEIEAGKRIQI